MRESELMCVSTPINGRMWHQSYHFDTVDAFLTPPFIRSIAELLQEQSEAPVPTLRWYYFERDVEDVDIDA